MNEVRVWFSVILCMLMHCIAMPTDNTAHVDNNMTQDIVSPEFTVEVAYEETAKTFASIPTSPKVGQRRNVSRDPLPGYDGCSEQQDRSECVELAHSLGALTGLFSPSYGNVLMPVPSLAKLVQMCDIWDSVMHLANIDPSQCCHLDHHCYQMRRNISKKVVN